MAVNSLTSTSVSLSDPRPSAASSDYTFKASSVTNGGIQCIQAVFSTTSGGDVAPTGWSGSSGSITAGSSSLINNSGSGWSLATSDGTSSTGQKNVWKYTHATTSVTPTTFTGATFVMSGITNSSVTDTSYFLKISTYNATDCTSSPVDMATVQFINTAGSTLSLSVDQTLTFSVAGVNSGQPCAGANAAQTSSATTLPFGSVTSGANSQICQDLTASTNATNGYTVYARYTGAPNDGFGHTIADVSPGTNTSPNSFSAAGTPAYGYTTNDQTLSTCGGSCSANRFYNGSTYSWAAMTTSNAEVAFESAGVASTTYRVSHQVGIGITTPAGSYSTNIIYTCTPVY